MSLDPLTAAARVATHLVAARELGSPVNVPRTLHAVAIDRVRRWPAWVGRAAVLRSRGAWWLWCERRKGARSGGQLVMDLPDGRYLIDLMDTGSHAWFSRESAAGAPLVAGLPAVGRALIARIRRVSTARHASRGRRP